MVLLYNITIDKVGKSKHNKTLLTLLRSQQIDNMFRPKHVVYILTPYKEGPKHVVYRLTLYKEGPKHVYLLTPYTL
jgi:hypothetical protein